MSALKKAIGLTPVWRVPSMSAFFLQRCMALAVELVMPFTGTPDAHP
ncbi:hypothetical protein [Pseudomonas rhizosphaerae]|nr:hypothetical protein [Pseudomonas rhizosphaerae]MEB2870076.1 hypothetical protein [Pseudomonas rhizosphaerae]